MKNCVICGKEFEPIVANQISCSKECARERQRKKAKQYFKDNREKVTAKRREYVRQNKDLISAIQKKSYQKHKEQRIAYSKKYNQVNKEKINARQREIRFRKKFDISLCGSVKKCLNCKKEQCIYEVIE